MGYSFTKLFSTITDSSIWSEDSDTRVVWVTMLAMSDRKGRVLSSLPGLAKRAAVPLQVTEKAISLFMAPDKYSRSTANEGRRIEKIEGGWRLLNYEFYRELRDEEAEKERKRNWAAEHRLQASIVAQSSAVSPQAEAEAEAKNTSSAGAEHKAFIDGWCSNFKAHFGVDYKMDGGKDGRAVKELLRLGILRIDLLEIAKKAWKLTSFAGRQAQTIHGFRAYFNNIQVEAKHGNVQTGQKPNPRNFGVSKDAAEQSKETVECLARREKERQDENPL